MRSIHMPFIEWFWHNISVLVPVFIFIIGGIFAMFHRFKVGIEEVIENHRVMVAADLKLITSSITLYVGTQAQQARDIAVLDTHRANVQTQLEEIRETTQDTNRKLDELKTAILQRMFKQ